MSTPKKLILVLVFLLVLTWPTVAFAKGLADDQVVFGGTFVLKSGETLNGNLLVFGGASTLEEDSRVRGDVFMFGGSIRVGGEITGDLIAIGGSIRLDDQAVISGDLIAPGGVISRASGAIISGEVITGSDNIFSFPFTSRVEVETPFGVRFFTNVLWFFFRTFALAALAVLVVMFFPAPTQRISSAIVSQPVVTGGVGLLTLIVAPLLILVMVITLILIPVSLLAVVVLGLAIVFGWIALGTEVGRRLGETINQDWELPLAAGVGTFLLTFVVNGVGFIPCVGWVPSAIVVLLGLGGVLMTRFGTQLYPQPDAGSARVLPSPESVLPEITPEETPPMDPPEPEEA